MIEYSDLLHQTNVYAHTSPYRNKELLTDHLDNTLAHFKRLENTLIINSCGVLNLDPDIVQELMYLGVQLHDIGKATPYFQHKKMRNPDYPISYTYSEELTYHSDLSGLIYLDKGLDLLSQHQVVNDSNYLMILLVVTMGVSKHHTSLKNLPEFKEKLINTSNYYKDNPHYDDLFSILKESKFYARDFNRLDIFTNLFTRAYTNTLDDDYLFILSQTFYGLLCLSDLIATKQYAQPNIDLNNERYTPEHTQNLIANYNRSDLKRYVSDYDNQRLFTTDLLAIEDINELRNNLALELNNDLRNITDTDTLYYLEAAVGSGKTHLANRFAIRMLQKGLVDKVIYTLPYLTISEQVESYTKTLDPLAVRVDSMTPVSYVRNEQGIDYGKTVLKRQTFDYRYPIISFVALFDLLFDTSTSSARKRMSLANSLIIIDEVQSINIKQLGYFTTMLLKYAEIYKFKILIMSATLPKISFITNQEGVSLIANSKEYIKHPCFASRNMLNTKFLNTESNVLDICRTLDLTKERLLVQCITKREAFATHELLSRAFPETNVLLFTGDTKKQERKELLEQLAVKNGNDYLHYNVILVSTNCIEAGVDIDMTKAILDLSFIDSLEQTSGRVNRNNLFTRYNSEIFIIDKENAKFLSSHKYFHTLELKNSIHGFFLNKTYDAYFERLLTSATNNLAKQNQQLLLSDYHYKDFSRELKVIVQEHVEFFVKSCPQAEELMEKYSELTQLFRTDYTNFDKHYLERLDCLIALQDYKEYATTTAQKEFVLNNYGDGLIFMEQSDYDRLLSI